MRLFGTCALIGALLSSSSSYGDGAGMGAASFSCPSTNYYDAVMLLSLEYTLPSHDVGAPGAIWVAVVQNAVSPTEAPIFLTLDSQWQTHKGGMFVPAARYDNGLPLRFHLDAIPLPRRPMDDNNGGDLNYQGYSGWFVYAGHGILSPAALNTIAARRATLEAQRESRVAAGTWRPEYDSDELIAWSLVQKDADDNGKYVRVGTIPNVIGLCLPWWGW